MSRVACTRCGQWRFHLAKTCPHCGAAQGAPEVSGEAPGKLELSPEEARSLLAVSAPNRGEPRLRDVAEALVLPRGGAAELVLCVLAVPVTVLTVVVLGYVVVQALRKRLPVQMRVARLLAVPTTSALAAVLLFEVGAPVPAWVALGVSLLAWVVRDVMRARARPDPLS